MDKSHRTAMAQAILASLAQAEAEKGRANTAPLRHWALAAIAQLLA
jgi:hypothetical protein